MDHPKPRTLKLRSSDFVSAKDLGIDFSRPNIHVTDLGNSIFKVEMSPGRFHPAERKFTRNYDEAIDECLNMTNRHYNYMLN